MGLKQQIKQAGSEAEISSLLSQGTSFTMASDRTKNSWKFTARRRLVELSSPSTIEPPEDTAKKSSPKKSYPKKTKKTKTKTKNKN